MKRQTLAEIAAYEKSREQKTATQDLHAWLAENVERYAGWLSRLQ